MTQPNALALTVTHVARFGAQSWPHVAKTAACCGIPALAANAGVHLWELPPAGEYGLAVGVAAAMTVAEAVWPGAQRHSLARTTLHFARNAAIAVGVTFAIHAAGLHHHGEVAAECEPVRHQPFATRPYVHGMHDHHGHSHGPGEMGCHAH